MPSLLLLLGAWSMGWCIFEGPIIDDTAFEACASLRLDVTHLILSPQALSPLSCMERG